MQRFLKVLIKTQSTWRREIKKQTHQLTLLFMVGLSEVATCSIRKLIVKSLQYLQETPVLDSIFQKRDLDPKFLILTTLKNICNWLLFNLFNGSLLYGSKDFRSRLNDGVWLQGPSYRPSFLFLSRHLSFWRESQPAFENLNLW